MGVRHLIEGKLIPTLIRKALWIFNKQQGFWRDFNPSTNFQTRVNYFFTVFIFGIKIQFKNIYTSIIHHLKLWITSYNNISWNRQKKPRNNIWIILVLGCLHRLQRHSLPNQVLIKLGKCKNEVSAFICSGKEFQIWSPGGVKLFVPYVFVFVLTTAILFGRLADEKPK